MYKAKVPGHTDQHSIGTDYRWRRIKVAYIAISIIIVVITVIGIQSANSSQTCGQTPSFGRASGSDWWGGSSTYFDCSSAIDRGEETSLAVALIPALILGGGYLLLPKLYRYLTPSRSDRGR